MCSGFFVLFFPPAHMIHTSKYIYVFHVVPTLVFGGLIKQRAWIPLIGLFFSVFECVPVEALV